MSTKLPGELSGPPTGLSNGPSRTIGDRFRIDAALPRSGQARVFLGHDLRTGADVVVKLVAIGEGAAKQALLTEFEMLARLDDPGLPSVIEVGDTGESLFVAIERIAGDAADRVCASLEGDALARCVAQILADGADALFSLHRNGLVHHDVKPQHLLRDASGRFRLIDLGLVRAIGRGDGSARGTLEYMSPDALVGASDPGVDLYALGISAHQLLGGAPPFAASDPSSLLQALARPRPTLRGPTALLALIDALTAIDPARRPSSARLVGEELVRAGLIGPRTEAPARASQTPSLRSGFVATEAGRLAALDQLEGLVQRFPVVALRGATGSGRTRLVEELDRRRALAALRAGAPRPILVSVDDAASLLGVSDVVPANARGVLAALARRGAVLHVCSAVGDWIRALDPLLSALMPGGARILLEVDEESGASLPPGIQVFDVPPLTDPEIALLCERAIGLTDPASVKVASRLATGRPGVLLEVLRAGLARARIAGSEMPRIGDLRAVRVEGLVDDLARVIAGLGITARRILAAMALLERRLAIEEVRTLAGRETAAALIELQTEGLVERESTHVRAHGDMITLAAWQQLGRDERGELVSHLLDTASRTRAPLDAARVASMAGHPDAARWCREALRALLDGALHPASPPPLARRLELAASVPGADGARLRGELLLEGGAYTEAALALEMVGEPRDEPMRRLLRARALRLAGRRADAIEEAHGIVDDPEVGDAARVFLARLRSDEGDYAAARALLDKSPPAGDEGESWLEVAGLAALHGGDAELARRNFLALRVRLQTRPPQRRARAEGLLGMAAQALGALEEAANAYELALALADEADDLHGAAIYAQNLGGALRELGELARAQASLERATAALERIGRVEERAMAWVNLGNLEMTMGDRESAMRSAETARQCAPSDERVVLYTDLLIAEVDRRSGVPQRALERYLACACTLDERLLVDCAVAETLVELGRMDEALAAVQRLAERCAREPRPPVLRLHAAISEARVRLLADEDHGLPTELAEVLGRELTAALAGQRRERIVRIGALLARDAIRRSDGAASTKYLELASKAYEEMSMRTPELRREALSDDPDIRRLRSLLATEPTHTVSDPSLRRLVEINKRLNSELDLDRLLELILDTVIELSRAERGFLLLRAARGELEIRSSRNVDPASAAHAAAFSRSIAERAIDEGSPIVTVDASGDRRFEAALSVSDLRLRSVLAVPLAVKGRVVGCVYVDHRARTGLFRPSDVSLVTDLAEQAAIAVENARLLADNRQKEQEVRQLNAQLEKQLASQSVELEGMHREVREARRTLGVRHDYAGLVGQTPRMVELFRLLDRVTDTALPVVIYGESGTGKELVARAIHHNGPRRKAAFVSESCAAIPETLLEAALFGHVRGAFTGAQGERRGLFEIADGGTLFLDEVGEMSPGMQVRLLRVLQEGEFRRVGGEKMLKVDVRVLVASNADLQRLVEAGRFREDLFYRLNVVRVALPPLRERVADIPLLVEHFLADRPGKTMTRGALDLLCRYVWPGNVRQLQNEIARAASLADAMITATDLSPQVQAGSDEADTNVPGPLDLHERVERLERSLLREALARTSGNQSEAARLLGLSRFGLQKKLRRYDLHPVRKS